MSLTEEFANRMLDNVFQRSWAALHTGDPGPVGTNELQGGQYARQPFGAGRAFQGRSANREMLDFLLLPVATITHLAVWDAPDGGKLIFTEQAESRRIAQGDSYRIDIGELSISLRIP